MKMFVSVRFIDWIVQFDVNIVIANSFFSRTKLYIILNIINVILDKKIYRAQMHRNVLASGLRMFCMHIL